MRVPVAELFAHHHQGPLAVQFPAGKRGVTTSRFSFGGLLRLLFHAPSAHTQLQPPSQNHSRRQ